MVHLSVEIEVGHVANFRKKATKIYSLTYSSETHKITRTIWRLVLIITIQNNRIMKLKINNNKTNETQWFEDKVNIKQILSTQNLNLTLKRSKNTVSPYKERLRIKHWRNESDQVLYCRFNIESWLIDEWVRSCCLFCQAICSRLRLILNQLMTARCFISRHKLRSY